MHTPTRAEAIAQIRFVSAARVLWPCWRAARSFLRPRRVELYRSGVNADMRGVGTVLGALSRG